MAYEAPKKAKAPKSGNGNLTVVIEKLTGEAESMNLARIQHYKDLGYDVKEDGYRFIGTIPEAKFKERERAYQEQGLRQVQGTRAISREDRQDGVYQSSVETLEPTTISDFLETEE
jgi:hypothetical protein